MTVYIDDMRLTATVGRLTARWSHLYIWPWDDLAELHDLAARIGLARRWFQDKPWPMEHYDVTDSKRTAAIKAGAVPVSYSDTGRIMLAARERGRDNPPPNLTAIIPGHGPEDTLTLF